MGVNQLSKVGRPKKIINYPSHNYTYLMYDIIDKKTNKLIRAIGATEEQAKAVVKFKKIKIKPTKVKELTDTLGHTKTNELLKKFGPQWICKEGKVFFERYTQ